MTSHPPRKLRVAVLYGGRSGEHEVSLRSASSVIRNLDPARFEVVPIAIDKQGHWLLNDVRQIMQAAQAGEPLPVIAQAPERSNEVMLPPAGPSGALVAVAGAGATARASGLGGGPVDVFFPVMHGPLCEDGTIQGLLELADIAYVGCGVLASAVGMDKDMAKRVARDAGIPIVPFIALKQGTWEKRLPELQARIERELKFPVFVKPCNMGSSVGVHKVKEASQLRAALEDSFQYDTKVLIEQSIEAREIELSVLENSDPNGEPRVSVVGEIAPTHEFYSYEAKYLDENGAGLLIPAPITSEQAAAAQKLARDTFVALGCEGMARVDLFLDKRSGQFYLNEINTLPGFTQISMYPKLWEASGLGYSELLTELVELAVLRHQRKQRLSREFVAKR